MFILPGPLYEEEGASGSQGSLPLSDPPAKPDPVAADLAQIKTQNLTLEQQLAALKQHLATLRPPAALNVNDVRRQVNEQLWQDLQNDPAKLLTAQEAIARQALAQYDQFSRQQRFPQDKILARNSVAEDANYREVFQKFSGEVEGYISKMWPNAPEAFTSPDVWRTAADAVRGQKWKELAPRENATDPGAPGKPSPRPMATTKGKDDEPLSEAEAYTAERVFGIDQKEYGRFKHIDKEQRSQATWAGRSMLQSPMAKMFYKDMNRTVSGFPNPHYGKMRPYLTFDSQVQKPRHPRDGE
jgi:hypothetical protein